MAAAAFGFLPINFYNNPPWIALGLRAFGAHGGISAVWIPMYV